MIRRPLFSLCIDSGTDYNAMKLSSAFVFLSLALLLRALAAAPNKLRCTQSGYCGRVRGDIGKLISAAVFDRMLNHRKDPQCPSQGFYSYDAFLIAARSFARLGFGTTGDDATRKRELLAFLAQTSHQTTGGWPTAPDGPYAWGYCRIRETSQDTYCKSDRKWPCAPGQKYYGRGPIQLTYNYNYGKAGRALGLNLLENPDLVATDAVVSFKTAIWFWMTPQRNVPSSHDVIIGKWRPSDADRAAKRVPGYGVITNIINGGYECGHGPDEGVADRIGFYKRYCDMVGISYGENLDCYFQKPFAYPSVTK